MTPDLSFLIGAARGMLLSLPCTCQVAAFGLVDPMICLVLLLVSVV